MNATATGFMLQTMLFMVNYNNSNILDTIYDEKIAQPQDSSEVRCYGVYGCFGVDGRVTLFFIRFRNPLLLHYSNNHTQSQHHYISPQVRGWRTIVRKCCELRERLQFSDKSSRTIFYLLSLRFAIDFFSLCFCSSIFRNPLVSAHSIPQYST